MNCEKRSVKIRRGANMVESRRWFIEAGDEEMK